MENHENAPQSPNPPAETLAVPHWNKGDAWEVAYRIRTVSLEKMAFAPPSYMEHRWWYEIDEVADTGRVQITGRHMDEDSQYKTRIILSAATWGLLEIIPQPSESIADGTPFLPLAHDTTGQWNDAWPAFPLHRGSVVFGDGEVAQSASEFSDYAEITIFRQGISFGTKTERTAVQRWEEGKPWWSTMTIRSLTTSGGKPYEDLEVEGKVVAWHLAQEGQP